MVRENVITSIKWYDQKIILLRQDFLSYIHYIYQDLLRGEVKQSIEVMCDEIEVSKMKRGSVVAALIGEKVVQKLKDSYLANSELYVFHDTTNM